MLSILIPVYNYDVTRLVTDLASQCKTTGKPFEIICADDGSNCSRPKIDDDYFTWHVNQQNEGRAKTRNILASLATFENLLFLDADVFPSNQNFIQTYLNQFKFKVVCGGICYEETPPETNELLRWNYGKKQEEVKAIYRNKKPYLSFMTGNFMCHKSVFETVTFNASLTTYGHEDTIFGKELLEHAIKIKHIDNPVIHLGLESNEEFVAKSKIGITSLVYLYKNGKITQHYSKLIRLHEKLSSFGLKKIVIDLIYKRSSAMKTDLIRHGKSTWKLQLLKLLWFDQELTE